MENIFRKYFEYYSTSMNYMEGFHFFKEGVLNKTQNLPFTKNDKFSLIKI